MAYVTLANGETRPVVTRDGERFVEMRMLLPCRECYFTDTRDCPECFGFGRVLDEWHEPAESFDAVEGEG